MKNLELQSLGLMELDAKEMVETEGGNPFLLYWAAFLLSVEVYDGITDFSEGFREAQALKDHSRCKKH